MNSWMRSSVVCPFFIADDSKRAIRCEGPVEHSRIDLIFDNKTQMRQHMEGWCSSMQACKMCEIHRMLAEKYQEDVDDE